MSDTMRDAFEAWCEKASPNISLMRHPDEPDRYECLFPDCTWQAWQAAQSQPAPPVPASVQEIMRLMNVWVSACIELDRRPVRAFADAQREKCEETFKPLQAALTALVDDNHRLRFELDGVNAMHSEIPDGAILHRMKYHPNIDGDGDWEIFTPDTQECADCIDVLIVRATHGIEPEQGGNHG